MFAVVRTGGKQYRVAAGDKIVVEKMDGDAGDRITLGDVLLAGDGSDLKPTDGLTVAAEIIAQGKGDKVTVFKKKRRKNYRRKSGHRQQHTILKIVAIGKEEKKPAKAKADSAPQAETAPEPDAAPAKKAEPKKTEAKADKPAAAKAEKKAAAPKAAKSSTKDAAPAKGAAKKSSKEK